VPYLARQSDVPEVSVPPCEISTLPADRSHFAAFHTTELGDHFAFRESGFSYWIICGFQLYPEVVRSVFRFIYLLKSDVDYV
jgi:hypothetical protein